MVSKKQVFEKIKNAIQSLGQEGVFNALVLYYTLRAPSTPAWCKSVIVGALAYFLSLIDAIPDLTPVLGYTDDVSVMAAAVAMLAAHITPEIKDRARQQSNRLFESRENLKDDTE